MSAEANYQAEIERSRQFREWAEGAGGLFWVFDEIEERLFNEFKGAIDPEAEALRDLHSRARALGEVRSALEAVITKGFTATAMIEALSKGQYRG